jgi:hypothetical protein
MHKNYKKSQENVEILFLNSYFNLTFSFLAYHYQKLYLKSLLLKKFFSIFQNSYFLQY